MPSGHLDSCVLLAFDDTDGPQGGCTTYLAFHVLLALPELALAGMPRLVRLNPNVPWKTRGNGAVLLPLGLPVGPSVRVGELRGMEILAYPEAETVPSASHESILQRAWEVVTRQSQPDAQPALALAAEPAPSAAYWQAVRTLVTPDEARLALDASGALHQERGEGRALAGCLGALSWAGPASSYEFIAYRHPSRWGTPRAVQAEPLLTLDATGATFHTSDPETNRIVCVPHGPDPVLLGLRGREAEALNHAATRTLPFACQEQIDGLLLWATNHASGDHVTPIPSLAEAPALSTVQVAAQVQAMPQIRAGGHTFLSLCDDAGALFQAAAFEPTKSLRDTVRRLRPGDRIEAVGAYREGRVNLEKLNVVSLAAHLVKADNPRCPTCGKGMKSAGKGQGFRCRDCKTRLGAEAGGWRPEEREGLLGWHEVPVAARRHLHRPVAWDRLQPPGASHSEP